MTAFKPNIYMLFGKSGAGKTYVGNLCAKEINALYFEGDLVIPLSMAQAITNKKQITKNMVNDFLLCHLKQKIDELIINQKDKKFLVVSQAFYLCHLRNIYRKIYGNKIQFILISASDKKCFERIAKRNDWVDVEYAKKMALNFEAPTPNEKHSVIYNDTEDNDKNLIKQLSALIFSRV